MKRFAYLVPLLMLALRAPGVGAAPMMIGDINNFDTINDTGQVCYGFEIEIDGIHSTDITYTYDWNHYGPPTIREDNSDPAMPKVFVTYQSTKDASGNFGANNSFTNVAIPSLSPPGGHSCTDPSVNEGCEHFGVGYYGTPAAVTYNWLVDGGGGSLVYFGTAVKVATPKFTYTPPAGGNPPQVVAVIPAPVVPIPVNRQFGEASWVKVIKTTSHNARPVALQDLISDDGNGDGKPDWQNGEDSEVEAEWKLLQTNNGANGALAELESPPEALGSPNENVTRRYEFYQYAGDPVTTIDGESGEAMCSDVNPTTDPANPQYLHGLGDHVAVTDSNGDTQYVDCTAQVVVGNYIGAQMAGFAVGAALGMIDHLQPGDGGVPYTPRTVVVGGRPPYSITVSSGNLAPGLSFDAQGVLSGTPSAGGDFPFTVDALDADGNYASQAYSLHISGPGGPQVDLIVERLGSGTGSVSGSGIDCGLTCTAHVDQGTMVYLTAVADPGSAFSGWGGACAGTGVCSFSLDAGSTVYATFARQWPLTVTRAGGGTGSVSGHGIDCGATCTVDLDEGTPVTLVATAAGGSAFGGWGGDCSGTGDCLTTMAGARSVTATFTTTNRDLVVAAVSSPVSSVVPGGTVGVSDTTKNQGGVDAAASTTRYYLSVDGVKSPGVDTLLTGARSVPILPAGVASSGTVNLKVPAATPLGVYLLLACADDLLKVAEASETNNCLAAPSTVQVAWPDLIETAITDPPVVTVPGGRFNATDTVLNQGAGPAVASTTRYYLSADAAKDAGDTLMAVTRSVGILVPNATSTGMRTLTVPLATTLGTYRLLACADDLAKAAEGDETNNCIASAGSILVQLPDLVETAITNPPTLAAPGGTFIVTDTVVNQGLGPSIASTTRYYLSLDAIRDAADVLVLVTRSVPPLPPGGTSVAGRTITVPATTPTGTYTLLACADDLTKVIEANEANNCIASAGSMVINLPDLVTTVVGTPPASIALGGTFAFSATVANQGLGPAAASTMRYYLSLDGVKDGGDLMLAATRSVGVLAPGAASVSSKTLTVPLTAAPAPYYVLACADDLLKVGESNEGNNCLASATAVTVHP